MYSPTPVSFALDSSFYSQSLCSLESTSMKPNLDFHPVWSEKTLEERADLLVDFGVDPKNIFFWINWKQSEEQNRYNLLKEKIFDPDTTSYFFFDSMLAGKEYVQAISKIAPQIFFKKVYHGPIPSLLDTYLKNTQISTFTVDWLIPLISIKSVQDRFLKEAPLVLGQYILLHPHEGIQNELTFETSEDELIFWVKALKACNYLPIVKEIQKGENPLLIQSFSSELNSNRLLLEWVFPPLQGLEIFYSALFNDLLKKNYTKIIDFIFSSREFSEFTATHIPDVLNTLEKYPSLESPFFFAILSSQKLETLLQVTQIRTILINRPQTTKKIFFKITTFEDWTWDSIPRNFVSVLMRCLGATEIAQVLLKTDSKGLFSDKHFPYKPTKQEKSYPRKILDILYLAQTQADNWFDRSMEIFSTIHSPQFNQIFFSHPKIAEMFSRAPLEKKLSHFYFAPLDLAIQMLPFFKTSELHDVIQFFKNNGLEKASQETRTFMIQLFFYLERGCFNSAPQDFKDKILKEYPLLFEWIFNASY